MTPVRLEPELPRHRPLEDLNPLDISSGNALFAKAISIFGDRNTIYHVLCNPLIYTKDHPDLKVTVLSCQPRVTVM